MYLGELSGRKQPRSSSGVDSGADQLSVPPQNQLESVQKHRQLGSNSLCISDRFRSDGDAASLGTTLCVVTTLLLEVCLRAPLEPLCLSAVRPAQTSVPSFGFALFCP